MTKCPASLQCLGEITLIEIQRPLGGNKALTPGAYVFIQLDELSAVEWHPFSVAHSNGSSVSLYVQAQSAGSWTRRLAELAASCKSEGIASTLSLGVDGPYGSLSLDCASYEVVHIFAGGIGITPFLHILDIIKSDAAYSTVKRVCVHWSMRGLELFHMMQDIIIDDRADAQPVPSDSSGDEYLLSNQIRDDAPEVHWMIYDTSLVRDSSDDSNVSTSSKPMTTLKKGRMSIQDIVATEKLSFDDSGRICILACGPKGMLTEVSKAAVCHGVDFHVEQFSY
jgi:ferric-chelate reductase